MIRVVPPGCVPVVVGYFKQRGRIRTRARVNQSTLTPSHCLHLHLQFAGKPFKVLAFPDNQFFAQEPGTNAEIAKCVIHSPESGVFE